MVEKEIIWRELNGEIKEDIMGTTTFGVVTLITTYIPGWIKGRILRTSE